MSVSNEDEHTDSWIPISEHPGVLTFRLKMTSAGGMFW